MFTIAVGRMCTDAFRPPPYRTYAVSLCPSVPAYLAGDGGAPVLAARATGEPLSPSAGDGGQRAAARSGAGRGEGFGVRGRGGQTR